MMRSITHFILLCTEAVVASKVVKFSSDLRFQNIMMEEDALKTVHALRRDGSCLSKYGQLVNDAKIVLNNFRS
jgi:hypothetical protein